MRRSRGIGAAARLATVGSAGVLLSATAFVGTAHAAGGVLDTSYGSGGLGPTSDDLTNTRSVTVSGSLSEAGLAVRLFDMTAGTDLGYATVAGTTFSAPVLLTSAGSHKLRAYAIDAAGNVSESISRGDRTRREGGRGRAVGRRCARCPLRRERPADTSFGEVWSCRHGGEDVALAVAVTANGKVVVGGRNTDPAQACAARWTASSPATASTTLIPVRGGDGLVTTDLVPGRQRVAATASRRSRSSPAGVIAAGTNGDIAMARLRPNGTLDGSFGTRGVVTADFNGWPTRPAACRSYPTVASSSPAPPAVSLDRPTRTATWRCCATGQRNRRQGLRQGRSSDSDLGAAFGERAVGLVRLSDGRPCWRLRPMHRRARPRLVRFKASGVIDRALVAAEW
jgi:hypothetical protein